MSIIETWRVRVWMGGDGLIKMEIMNWEAWSYLDFKNGYLSTFKGKRATVAVFTDDTEITREMKLKCATDFMDGNYVTIEVNLNSLTSRIVKGEAH